MEQKITVKKPKTTHGGKRPGAGRPNNVGEMITVKGLLAELRKKTNQDYEEILVQDFMNARSSNDRALTMKYHQLILARVMNNLNRVEIVDNGEQLKQKEQAFVQALQQMIVLQQQE